jgi:hypothetical protein
MDGGADSCSGRMKVEPSIEKSIQKCIDVNAGGIYVNARNKNTGLAVDEDRERRKRHRAVQSGDW